MTDAPTTTEARGVDLVGHFQRLARVAPAALLIAVVVGTLTLLMLERAEPSYRVTSTAQIDAQIPIVPGDAYLFQNNAPYIALAASHDVHQAVATQLGNGWTADRVADNVEVAVAQSPLLLSVSATAGSPQDAIALSQKMIEVLDDSSRAQRAGELDRAVAEQVSQRTVVEQQLAALDPSDPARPALELRLADIQNQINRILAGGVNGLSALSVPGNGDAIQTSPRSPTVALFAALVAFILSVEVLALARGRFGSRLTRAAAERIAHSAQLELEFGETGSLDAPPITLADTARHHREGRRTQVLATPESAPHVTKWTGTVPGVSSVLELRGTWALDVDPSVAEVVVVGCRNEHARGSVTQAVGVLRELGVGARLVVLTPPKPTVAGPTPVGAESVGAAS